MSPTILQAMVTDVSSVEEQLANLTKMIKGLTNHVHNQEYYIDKLMNKMDGLMDGESNHSTEKGIYVQETTHL